MDPNDNKLMLEKEISKFDNYVDFLWKRIIQEYIHDVPNNGIISKLTEQDKNTFYKYMLDNSPAINMIIDKLNLLTKKTE
jgi:hypothetical protein